jgi:membrane fusion protein, multidrug efflux system
MSDATPAGRGRKVTRRQGFMILAGVVAVCAIGYALDYFLFAINYQSTNDAYVGGDVVSITSREPGTILTLHADNTQGVRRGQLLVELDPVKANVALDAAEADLARTVRNVRTNFSKVDELRAQLAAAQIGLAQANSDYRRRASAGAAVSGEELAHARDAMTAAQANLRVAESGLVQALASVQNTTISSNPDVLASVARLRQAAIVLAHMRLYSPVDGEVAQRTAEIGQQISPGTPLMAVVPLDNVWIDANFTEVQLRNMRIDQPVTVTADIYGGSVIFHGRVLGLGAGSGSAFALLPPQNASGNWIKIVQRVPVRIALNSTELRAHPLRIGLSVSVSVDVSDTSGSSVASLRPLRELGSAADDDGDPQTDRLIQVILAQNGG